MNASGPTRPFALDPLFRAQRSLSGVGPKNEKLLARLTGGEKLLDLLFHLPIDLVDRRYSPKVAEAQAGQVATLKVRVHKHIPPPKRGAPFRVWCTDETSTINLIFFNARAPWIVQQLPEGSEKLISGRIDAYNDALQMVHPDAIGELSEFDEIAVCEPVYPLTQGVTNKVLRKVTLAALKHAPALPEWHDQSLIKRRNWPAWRDALEMLHQPESAATLAPDHPARQRLAYDEMLSNQLALALIRRAHKKGKGRSYPAQPDLLNRLKQQLPFSLTGAQERALREIEEDMAAEHRMLRLLQGDVGSGKTVVAAAAMLQAVGSGAQAALMAPTEILARQHAETLKPWLAALNIPFVTLTGRDKGKARAELLEQISNGAARIVIGTHALFQDTIEFHNLGFAVIDEQHRFGVHQRLKLSDKGKGVDILVMTATPIPRTLTLTAYGDMDVSRLDEKPPGRKPVDTRLISKEQLPRMVEGLGKEIAKGTQIYWVCPLVEESEVLDVAAAEERHAHLQQLFGDQVGLVHGRMAAEEKDRMMRDFSSGALKILNATTVIEVGVNVPNATIIVIEHAERFGLAQLHQLRGRVGRGGDQSYCFLIYDGPLSETAKERLDIMRRSEDGFLIAEKDLELRGAGDLLGTQQSGLPRFRLAPPEGASELLAMAADEAKLILNNDADLEGGRGEALRTLLYLFERDRAIALLRSG